MSVKRNNFSEKISDDNWKCKLQKKGRLGTPVVEVTPFVFNEKLYRLENWQKSWDTAPYTSGDKYLEDEVRIRDVEEDKIVSIPLTGCAFAAAFVWDGKSIFLRQIIVLQLNGVI